MAAGLEERGQATVEDDDAVGDRLAEVPGVAHPGHASAGCLRRSDEDLGLGPGAVASAEELVDALVYLVVLGCAGHGVQP